LLVYHGFVRKYTIWVGCVSVCCLCAQLPLEALFNRRNCVSFAPFKFSLSHRTMASRPRRPELTRARYNMQFTTYFLSTYFSTAMFYNVRINRLNALLLSTTILPNMKYMHTYKAD